MASEERLRQAAVALYLEGKKVSAIANQLGRSRQWVHKWINRFKSASKDWSVSRSNAPHQPSERTSESTAERVIAIRKELMDSPYHESGAYAIWHRMKEQGLFTPSVATINRILKKRGLIRGHVRYQKSGIPYPETAVNTQVMDLIGPLYLKGGLRYYLLTIISNDTRHAGVYPIPSKSARHITQSIVSFWKEYSIPCFLQMDNELSFKGSNRHPRGLGLLLRTALGLNVIPVLFPWQNLGETVSSNDLTRRLSAHCCCRNIRTLRS